VELGVLEAISEFGARDALDVAVAAALIYLGFRRLRQSQRALVAVGIALAGGGYLAASGLGLGLTTWVFHGFFAVLALALVIIFQDDLRQIFEELAAWALGRRDDYRPRLDSTEILVSCLSRLARQKTGALVVLPGLQRLDRHLSGGVELRGGLSGALIESIFDRHSPGHDGAMVVEDRQATRFGVQLPLCRNPEQLAGLGTRHSAALGLSERTDAICIVVSEERGSVSIAYGGVLREIVNPTELKTAIDHFYRHRRTLPSPSTPFGALQRRPVEKVSALVLALVLWALFVGASRPVERVYALAVDVLHVPAGLTVASVEPSTIRASLEASLRSLWFLDPDELRVAVDVASGSAGTSVFPLSGARVRPAGSFEVVQLHGEEVRVSLARETESAPRRP
jgi:uncharacterized protein (TIGR00159 family)